MKSNIKTIMLSMVVMALWGSLFPMIKIGYNVFGINSVSIPDILMFASIRFIISGFAVCIFAWTRNEKLANPKTKNILNIFIMGIFSIVLHYAFTYIGLSSTDSSKAALIKQLGALIYICFAFLFFKDEKFSFVKIVGALIGFCGIIAINYNPDGISFSTGDILIICASLSVVIASIISKKSAEDNSAFWITGISQFSGGIILFVIGILMGGDLPIFSIKGLLVFSYICTASITSYTIWYYVQRTADLSKLFIIKFAEPLFACVFGALLIGENIFKVQYLAAFILISAGIVLANKN